MVWKIFINLYGRDRKLARHLKQHDAVVQYYQATGRVVSIQDLGTTYSTLHG